MANKKTIKHVFVKEDKQNVAALSDGERSVTMSDYDASQSRNAALVRDYDNSQNELRTTKAELSTTQANLADTSNKLNKTKRTNKIY